MISLTLAGLSVKRAAADPPSGYHLAFDEEFSGTSIADTRVNYMWTGYPGASSTTDAVSVGGGNLTLTTYSTGSGANMQNWGGCVGTSGTYAYIYGYTEARIKFNNTQGVDMSYWLDGDAMFNTALGSTPQHGNEVDIIEQHHTDSSNRSTPNEFHMNIWASYILNNDHKAPNTQPTVANLENTWHTIGLLWTSSGYTFSCDGVNLWSYGPDNNFVSHGPEFLIFGHGTATWCGSVPSGGYGSLATSTTKMSVDYVRVYQASSQAWNSGAGGNGTWTSSNTNWNFTDGGAAATWTNGGDAYFRGSDGTITVSGFTPSVNSLNFDTGNFAITGGIADAGRQ